MWTPVNPTNSQNLGIHGATPKRGCAEMAASTIYHQNTNRCSIPHANQVKSRYTGIDGAIPKSGCKSPQNTAEKVGSLRNPPKHRGNRCRIPVARAANPIYYRWHNPQKRLQFISKHSWKGLKRRDPQEIPQNTAGIGGKSFKPNQNLKKMQE